MFCVAFAIIFVILNHCDEEHLPGFSGLDGVEGFLYWSVKGLGWSGVDLFFVLSGFLIAGLLFSELDKTGTLKISHFLLRRGLKLWPSYFVLLIVLGVTSTTNFIDYSGAIRFIGSILVHVLFLQNYLGLDGNGPTWSLAVEEHFYTLLPLFLLAVWGCDSSGSQRSKYLLSLSLLVISIVFILRVYRLQNEFHVDDFMFTHFRFDSLFYGVVCQYVWRYHNTRMRQILSHVKVLIVLAFFLIMPAMFLSRANPFMFTVGFNMLFIGYGIVLLLMVSNGLGRYENYAIIRMLAAVGQWSYNIYLWHFFLPVLLGGFVYFCAALAFKLI